MAKLGHVSSTAITGEKSPAFIKAGVTQTAAIAVKQDEAALQLQAAHEKIDQLTDLFAKFLATQTPATVEEKPVEPAELTAGQKAAQTRAENKAKAEAEAKVGE